MIKEPHQLNQYIITKDEDENLKLDIYREIELNEITIYDNELEVIIWIMQRYFFMSDLTVEYIYVIAYDSNDWLKGVYLASIGDENHAESFPKEIITFLILINAKSFLLIHNHPNNGLCASGCDEKQFSYFSELAFKIGLNFKGSYIITKDGWVNVLTKKRNFFNDVNEEE